MAYNDDALEVIVDIKEALAEFGSTIKIVTQSQDNASYNPDTGLMDVVRTEITTKGIIKSRSTNENLNKAVESYEQSIMFYTDTQITTNNLINFRGNDFEIVPKGLDEKILQNTTYLYEVLVKRNKLV